MRKLGIELQADRRPDFLNAKLMRALKTEEAAEEAARLGYTNLSGAKR